MNLTKDDINALQHSLGLTYGERIYRNYYCANLTGGDQLEKLVSLGLMFRGARSNCYQYYHVTDMGKKIALDNMPKLTRAKRRYIRFLDAKDAYPDLTFRQFLTDPFFSGAANGSRS